MEEEVQKVARISQVGIELEGGWDTLFEDGVIGHDGSVQRPTNAAGAACGHWGELASLPLSREAALAWLRAHYPSGVNASCGMHIHVSFKRNLDYSRLMSHAFYRHFLDRIKAWAEARNVPKDHQFWPRWAGQNQYCKKEFSPDTQSKHSNKGANRYSHLNYCFKLHGTLENRLSPGWSNVEDAVSYTEAYLDIVEDWLAKAPPEKAMILKIGIGKTQKKGL